MPSKPAPGPVRVARASELFDLIAGNPDPPGWTLEEIYTDLDVSPAVARTAIHDLRLLLGETHIANLVCENHGLTWYYWLDGNLDGVRPWSVTRMRDEITRLRTMRAVHQSVEANQTDKRTRDARFARTMVKNLSRQIEDAEEILEEVEVTT